MNKKSWLIPYEILQEYLKTQQHLFKPNNEMPFDEDKEKLDIKKEEE